MPEERLEIADGPDGEKRTLVRNQIPLSKEQGFGFRIHQRVEPATEEEIAQREQRRLAAEQAGALAMVEESETLPTQELPAAVIPEQSTIPQ